MKLIRKKILCMVLPLVISSFTYAQDEPVKNTFLPTNAVHANWVFSGVVTNENGEYYGYFFQMQRDEQQFHATTALFDGQSRQMLLYDDSYANLADSSSYNWKVGASFLRFNPITDSWVFGLKNKDKKGFNFKVDMLSFADNKPITQGLRPGIDLVMTQTGHLNGHFQIPDDKEQFVTAKSAWFRQVWISENQTLPHPFSGVLCRFSDGSGFYSINMREMDVLRGAITGAYNEQGLSMPISQFIKVEKDKDETWHIRIASPNHHLAFSDAVKQNSVVAGFVVQKEKLGFCMLSEDVLGSEKQATV